MSLKPETVNILLLVLCICCVHAFDAFETYLGIKTGRGVEKNPITRTVINELGVGYGLLYICVMFYGCALYPIYNALYADYYDWYSLYGSWYANLVYLMLGGLLVLRIIVCLWNLIILIPAPSQHYIPRGVSYVSQEKNRVD